MTLGQERRNDQAKTHRIGVGHMRRASELARNLSPVEEPSCACRGEWAFGSRKIRYTLAGDEWSAPQGHHQLAVDSPEWDSCLSVAKG